MDGVASLPPQSIQTGDMEVPRWRPETGYEDATPLAHCFPQFNSVFSYRALLQHPIQRPL